MWLDDDDRMGRDGMGYIEIDIDIDIDIIAIYMKHDTINNQPTKQPNKERRCKQQQQPQYTPDTLFMMIPPSF